MIKPPAKVSRAPVLPDDGAVDGAAGGALPQHHRLPLVGDAERREIAEAVVGLDAEDQLEIDAAMIALEHAPELRVAGLLPGVIAESQRRQRAWGDALDAAAKPAAIAEAMPTAAIGASVLGVILLGLIPSLWYNFAANPQIWRLLAGIGQ